MSCVLQDDAHGVPWRYGRQVLVPLAQNNPVVDPGRSDPQSEAIVGYGFVDIFNPVSAFGCRGHRAPTGNMAKSCCKIGLMGPLKQHPPVAGDKTVANEEMLNRMIPENALIATVNGLAR